MIEVRMLSAVTLIIKDMRVSCSFYSKIPGFRLIFGGHRGDSFTTYQMGHSKFTTYLNLEQKKFSDTELKKLNKNTHFGRIIFYTNDVDKLYLYFKNSKSISNMISLENEPINAQWDERYFHLREPDGYQLSFAQPIKEKKILYDY